MSLSSTEVKKLSQVHKLRIYQPEDINKQESVDFLKGLSPDIFVVVAFGQILSKSILEIPRIMAINLHASELPKYRGAAPINWALIRGETQTGVSIIKMVEKLDAGPLILQRSLDIEDNEDAQVLADRLSKLGSDLLLEALDLIQDNKYKFIVQDEKKATFAPKLKKDDGLIYWDKSAGDLFNLIRGCAIWPSAFTYYQGRILKIHKAKLLHLSVSQLERRPGRILQISKEGIVVATGKGNLLITELQIEGKKRISASDFISGYRISVGNVLGDKNSCNPKKF